MIFWLAFAINLIVVIIDIGTILYFKKKTGKIDRYSVFQAISTSLLIFLLILIKFFK